MKRVSMEEGASNRAAGPVIFGVVALLLMFGFGLVISLVGAVVMFVAKLLATLAAAVMSAPLLLCVGVAAAVFAALKPEQAQEFAAAAIITARRLRTRLLRVIGTAGARGRHSA